MKKEEKVSKKENWRFVMTIMLVCWAFCSLLFLMPAISTPIIFLYHTGSFHGFSWEMVSIDWEQTLIVSGLVSALFLFTSLLSISEEKEKEGKETKGKNSTNRP